VPEPATLLLFGVRLPGVYGFRGFKKYLPLGTDKKANVKSLVCPFSLMNKGKEDT